MRFLLRCLKPAVLGFVLLSCMPDSATGPSGFDLKPRFDLSAYAGSIVITEIMADPDAVTDANGEWFEVYNGGAVAVDLQNFRIVSLNDAVHTISASAVVPAGGYAVIARNGNPATNGGVTPLYAYSSPTPVLNLANAATEWLALRDPSGNSVDSVLWGATAPAGASRGVIDVSADNTLMNGANWATQTPTFGAGDRGTPGAANVGPLPPPPTGAIVINEVLADPSAVLDAAGEWFEVHNRTTDPIDLRGWIIRSGNDGPHVIAASVVVTGGGFAVLGRNADVASNGGVTLDYNYASATTLNLGNGSDFLALDNPSGSPVELITWASTPTGATRALIDPASNNTEMMGAAWFNSTQVFGAGDRGTPGLPNGIPVTGEPGVAATVSIAINTPMRVPVGYTKPAFPTVRDGVGATMSPLPELIWASSNPSVATVDRLGYITGHATGATIISATTPNGASGQASFSVIAETAPTTAIYRNHVEFGTPGDTDDPDGIVLKKAQFVSSYSSTRGGPNWVSWNINSTHFGGAPRCDCFTMDRSLPANIYSPVDFDYRNGGYDRGHMVQSESRTTTDQENAATFLLTNILPQANANNTGPWLKLENHLNDLARNNGKEIYVIAGGEYSSSPATLKNEGKIQIPEFTWKVAVILDGGEGVSDVRSTSDIEVIAVRMPNTLASAEPTKGLAWDAAVFETTVDAIERATGYDLLSELPDAIEAIVESETKPPVAATSGPYSSNEGAFTIVDGSASSDPDRDALTYSWTFGDGGTGTGATATHQYVDNGTYIVELTVTDPYGLSSTATTTVTVNNVAPAVSIVGGSTLLPGETFASTGSFADPGTDTWSAVVNYGDGSAAQPLNLSGKAFALNHTYHAAGSFTVTVTVTDDDGGVGSRTTTVTVITQRQGIARLQSTVRGLTVIPQGNVAAMISVLTNASASVAREDIGAAVNQLRAFINQIEAEVNSGRLDSGTATALTNEANRIIESLEN